MSTAESKPVLDTGIRADVLDTTLGILRTAGDEAILRLGKDGLDVALVDPANAMLHFIEIDAAAFEYVPEGEFAIGTNLERLQDTIGKADPDATVTLAFNPETRRLNVRYGNVDVDIAMIDPDSIRSEPDAPDLDLPNRWVMSPAAFRDAVDIVEMVTDHIGYHVDTDAETVTLMGEGDTDTATVTFDSADLISCETNRSVSSLYNMNYTEDIASVVTGEEVEFRHGEEFPLRVFYEYADGHASVETLLAPRIQT